MKSSDSQTGYWNRAAASKSFTHPFDENRFHSLLPTDARILDCGCGQGRILGILENMGFHSVIGIDFAFEMIRKAIASQPVSRFLVADASRPPFKTGILDAVVLFAVLNCIPDDERQIRCMDMINRILRPGGIVYISDYPLQEDDRNRRRYEAFAGAYGHYGIFQIPGGAVFRHHDRQWIATLTSGFEKIHWENIDVATMNGHPAKAFQYWGRKA